MPPGGGWAGRAAWSSGLRSRTSCRGGTGASPLAHVAASPAAAKPCLSQNTLPRPGSKRWQSRRRCTSSAAGSATSGSCGARASGDGGGAPAGNNPPFPPTWWNNREELRSTVQPGTWQDTAGRGREATGGGACAAAAALPGAPTPGKAFMRASEEATPAAVALWAMFSRRQALRGGRSRLRASVNVEVGGKAIGEG